MFIPNTVDTVFTMSPNFQKRTMSSKQSVSKDIGRPGVQWLSTTFFLPAGAFDPKSKDYDKISMMRAVFGMAIAGSSDENCTLTASIS